MDPAQKAKLRTRRFNFPRSDTDIKNPDLIYLDPEGRNGIPRSEFFGTDVFMAGFDSQGNPVDNGKRRKKKKRMDNLISSVAKRKMPESSMSGGF